jgi:hypothetical protein
MADDGLSEAILATLIPSLFVGTLVLRTKSKDSIGISNFPGLWIRRWIKVEIQSSLRSQKRFVK